MVQARQESAGLHRWIVWADTNEVERLRAYRDRDIGAEHRRRWTAEDPASEQQNGAKSWRTQITL